ncbi:MULTISPECIES: hypothetical protein [Achromobacter]|uniref:hypothetical protein n=1 Tax=Achromobacter TaxID=222 RepID=UPI0023F77F73|nr:hypothetical protein [Achromobacter anxifer]MDF8362049.1 hypothetical protein [Achromobacter anxifer]
MTDHHRLASESDQARRYIFPLGPPMAVNVKGLPLEQVHALLDGLETLLGGSFFRDRELLLEVLKDQVAAAANPRAFLYGPYVALVTTQAGVKRITSMNEIGTDSGMVVYAADQVIERFAQINDEGAGVEIPSRSRPRS